MLAAMPDNDLPIVLVDIEVQPKSVTPLHLAATLDMRLTKHRFPLIAALPQLHKPRVVASRTRLVHGKFETASSLELLLDIRTAIIGKQDIPQVVRNTGDDFPLLLQIGYAELIKDLQDQAKGANRLRCLCEAAEARASGLMDRTRQPEEQLSARSEFSSLPASLREVLDLASRLWASRVVVLDDAFRSLDIVLVSFDLFLEVVVE